MSNPPLTPASPAQDPSPSQSSGAPQNAPTQPAPSTQPAAPAGPRTDFDIGEEYGTARKNLPPVWIVAICVAIIVVGVGIYAATHRAHPLSTGSVDDVVAVAMPDQKSVMVAINVTLHNNELKPAWIKSISVTTDVGGTKHSDDAAPGVDAQEYLASLPGLKAHALQVLTTETRINPGEQIAGTIVVSFPVTADAFAGRKSLTVTVTPYDEVPVVLTK